MNVKVSRGFEFASGIHFDNSFIINTYNIVLSMTISTTNTYEQSIALERLKYFIFNCLENCVFVNKDNKSVVENYINAGMRVCTLPDESYDQIIGLTLLSKFNAILEEKVFVDEIKISSMIGNGINFHISMEESSIFSSKKNSWYTEPNISISDYIKKEGKKDKVVQLKKESSKWVDLGLDWKQKEIVMGNEITFVNVDKVPN